MRLSVAVAALCAAPGLARVMPRSHLLEDELPQPQYHPEHHPEHTEHPELVDVDSHQDVHVHAEFQNKEQQGHNTHKTASPTYWQPPYSSKYPEKQHVSPRPTYPAQHFPTKIVLQVGQRVPSSSKPAHSEPARPQSYSALTADQKVCKELHYFAEKAEKINELVQKNEFGNLIHSWEHVRRELLQLEIELDEFDTAIDKSPLDQCFTCNEEYKILCCYGKYADAIVRLLNTLKEKSAKLEGQPEFIITTGVNSLKAADLTWIYELTRRMHCVDELKAIMEKQGAVDGSTKGSIREAFEQFKNTPHIVGNDFEGKGHDELHKQAAQHYGHSQYAGDHHHEEPEHKPKEDPVLEKGYRKTHHHHDHHHAHEHKNKTAHENKLDQEQKHEQEKEKAHKDAHKDAQKDFKEQEHEQKEEQKQEQKDAEDEKKSGAEKYYKDQKKYDERKKAEAAKLAEEEKLSDEEKHYKEKKKFDEEKKSDKQKQSEEEDQSEEEKLSDAQKDYKEQEQSEKEKEYDEEEKADEQKKSEEEDLSEEDKEQAEQIRKALKAAKLLQPHAAHHVEPAHAEKKHEYKPKPKHHEEPSKATERNVGYEHLPGNKAQAHKDVYKGTRPFETIPGYVAAKHKPKPTTTYYHEPKETYESKVEPSRVHVDHYQKAETHDDIVYVPESHKEKSSKKEKKPEYKEHDSEDYKNEPHHEHHEHHEHYTVVLPQKSEPTHYSKHYETPTYHSKHYEHPEPTYHPEHYEKKPQYTHEAQHEKRSNAHHHGKCHGNCD
ncbi:hypothetical protein G7046_g6538 [Stylonectria norvegica]|nr:hypothetical protein G7046_g6538 [Stylonectria norvegica]